MSDPSALRSACLSFSKTNNTAGGKTGGTGGEPEHYSTHVCAVIRQVVSRQVVEVPPEWCLDLQTEGSREGGGEG